MILTQPMDFTVCCLTVIEVFFV